MKLFLLSRTDNLNPKLKQALKEQLVLHGNKIAYISSNYSQKYYQSTIADFQKVSENVVVDYLNLSSDFSDRDLEKLTNYKAIYLSGGNTYSFLKDAQERNLKSILEKALSNGALLIGASAGSIMMTPTIDICGFADQNEVNLTNTSGFNFVDFEFHPHYEESDLEFLNTYQTKNDLYLCPNGDGIFYNDMDIELFGAIKK